MYIDWNSDRQTFLRGNPIEIQRLRAKEDYLVVIRAGTGAPGAQQQQQAQEQKPKPAPKSEGAKQEQ